MGNSLNWRTPRSRTSRNDSFVSHDLNKRRYRYTWKGWRNRIEAHDHCIPLGRSRIRCVHKEHYVSGVTEHLFTDDDAYAYKQTKLDSTCIKTRSTCLAKSSCRWLSRAEVHQPLLNRQSSTAWRLSCVVIWSFNKAHRSPNEDVGVDVFRFKAWLRQESNILWCHSVTTPWE